MNPIQLTAQIYEIKAKRDGGSRIILDTGADSLASIQELIGLMAENDINLALAIVPFRGYSEPAPMESVDPSTGEILIGDQSK